MGPSDVTINGGATVVRPGDLVQVERELLLVSAVQGAQCTVSRGVNGSTQAAHNAGAAVYVLASKTVILPFPKGFFGSPYCGDWSYPILLPDVRVACADLWVTNAVGDSPKSTICLTHSVANGMRTLMGGQYSVQVSGYLSVDSVACPALIIDTKRSVGQIYAGLGTAADSEVQVRVNVNGVPYCVLSVPAGMIVSNSVDGFGLPPLEPGALLTVSILSVGKTYPGADLTVFVQV